MCIRGFISNEDVNEQEQREVQQDTVETIVPGHVQPKMTKSMEKYMKRYKNMEEDMDRTRKVNNKNYNVKSSTDILAQSTSQLKMFLDYSMKHWKIFQHSNAYKILFKTTQPAHIIAVIGVLCAISAVVPRSDVKINNANQTHSKLWSFIYLTSFILHIGSQFWMTFVSGLSLYFALPRHNFGQVQRVLFPRYFTINACLSLTTLAIFLKFHPISTWNTEIVIQVGGMFIAFFLELFIRLYLAPPLIGLISAKAAIEKAAGVGNEIGHQVLGPLDNCPHYLKMHRTFRKIHMCTAIGNILTMVCTVLHLNYLVNKICL